MLDAKRSVWIATANLKELMVEGPVLALGRRRNSYRSVLEAFDELAQRGVELRILHASLPSRPFRDEFDRHQRLVSGGLQLRMCPRVHLKTVIVDARVLVSRQRQLDRRRPRRQGRGPAQLRARHRQRRRALLDQVQALYEQIWSGAAVRGVQAARDCEAPLCDAGRPPRVSV